MSGIISMNQIVAGFFLLSLGYQVFHSKSMSVGEVVGQLIVLLTPILTILAIRRPGAASVRVALVLNIIVMSLVAVFGIGALRISTAAALWMLLPFVPFAFNTMALLWFPVPPRQARCREAPPHKA